MRSELTIDTNLEPEEKLFDANQDYWMFGILKEVKARDKLFPYGDHPWLDHNTPPGIRL
ncbi:MAG: hypothetical protein KFF73_15450 [Cyclobacteriaceae bacterium]|nr:hypothetical protein [Cyclobacteriaceae bacterium]